MVRPRKNVSKRNIALRIETYERLERFLLELMRKRGTARVTFDEAINALLDEHEEKEREGCWKQGQRVMTHNTGRLEGLYSSTPTSAKEGEPSRRP
jgi:hypothetical protein